MSIDQYARAVDLLLAELHDPEHDGYMAPLLSILGCCSVEFEDKKFFIRQPGTLLARHEPVIRPALLSALCWHAGPRKADSTEAIGLLHGLTKNERWRDAIEASDIGGAYALASNITYFLLIIDTLISKEEENAKIEATLVPGVLTLLNAWTKPKNPHTTIPTAQAVLGDLFGDAWYSLVASDCSAPALEIPTLIFSTRPPFLPGLTCQVHVEAAGLPALEHP
jgi:hypothetical protein